MFEAVLTPEGRVNVSGTSTEMMKFRAWLSLNENSEKHKFITGKLHQITIDVFARATSSTDFLIAASPRLSELAEFARLELSAHQGAVVEGRRIISRGSVNIPELGDLNSILHPHQRAAAQAMAEPGLLGACLFDEQGVGKSLTTVAAYKLLRLHELIDQLIIVCPKTLLGTWVNEIATFLGGDFTVEVVAGNPSERKTAMYSEADVFCMTYETISSDLALVKALTARKRSMLVADESFLVKNAAARRSEALRELRAGAARCFVLCGTPAPNMPADVIHQVDIADGGISFKGFSVPDELSAAIPSITKRLEESALVIRRTKAEVLPTLAPKEFVIHRVQMLDEQRDLYVEAQAELILYLKRLDQSTFERSLITYFQKRAALLQICVSPALIGHATAPSAKYAYLQQLAESFLADDAEKLIVWSSYTAATDHVAVLLEKYGVARVDGTVAKAAIRQERVRQFQQDPSTRIFLGNPAAAGAGLTLTAAHRAIYLSLSNQAAAYMQSIDRIHRIGQTAQKVEYHMVICDGTIEESEVKRLTRKQSAQAELLGDPGDDGLDLATALRELGAS